MLIKNLLSSNWTSGNTGSRTPQYSEYKNKKRLAGYRSDDWVLTYKRINTERPTSLGNTARDMTYNCSIDVRTNVSEEHMILMLEEIKRIIRANVSFTVATATDGTVGQQCIIEKPSETPFANSEGSKLYHNYRMVIEVSIGCPNESV